MAEWSARWLDGLVHLNSSTRRSYESLLDTVILPTFGNRALAAVDAVTVRGWVAKLSSDGLSASRTRQAYRLLSALVRGAVEAGLIARNPVGGVKLPRLPHAEQWFLTAAEVGALADAAVNYGVLVLVLAYGALRWGEAAALRRGRVDVLRSRLHVAESVTEVNGALVWGRRRPTGSR